jgi:hypothetical protein
MRLRSRVVLLARLVGPSAAGRGFRWVMVEPGDGPAIARDESGYASALRVPRAAGRDPEAALTAEQRAAIRSGDRLIVVCMPDDPDPEDNDPPRGTV